MKQYNFRVWEKRVRGAPIMPNQISVTKSGSMQLSTELKSKYFQKPYVEIHYDADNHIIGLKPTESDMGYTVHKRSKHCSSSSINTPKICRVLRITPNRYDAEWIPQLSMLVFQYEERGAEK